jgi:hypothetical protein
MKNTMNALKRIISGSRIQQTNASGRGESLAALTGVKRRPAWTSRFQIVGWAPGLLAAGLLVAVSSVQAPAAATLSLYDGVNPLITVVDNGPGDELSLITGAITIATNVGVWNLTFTTGLSKLTLGSATDPVMEVNIIANSIAAGSLRVVFSDNSFGPAAGTLHATIGGVVTGAVSTVSYSVYGDPANVVGATTVLIASTGTIPLTTGGTASGSLGLGVPFSLTQVLQFIASGATHISADASFRVGEISLTPARATNEVNTAHTVCASVTVLTNGVTRPAVGTVVNINITNGPNAGISGTAVTGTNGVVCLSYTGAGGVGTDIIVASFTDPSGRRQSTFATKVWVASSNQPPVVICHSPLVVNNDAGLCSAMVTAAQVDNGSYSPRGGPLTFTLTPPAPFPVGDNLVTFTATDTNGLSTSTNVHIVVVDAEPPTIYCPAPITAEFQDENGAVVTYVVWANDQCPGVNVSATPPSGSLFPIGVTPVLATAVDSSSNSSQCTFTVTVLGAQGVKSNVLAELIALRASTPLNQSFAVKFDYAILHLRNSLNPAYWIDQTHLQPAGGNMALNEEKLAANMLGVIMHSGKCPVDPAVLQGFIARILKADRLLAIISIQEAASAGVSARKVAQCVAAVAKGDEEAAAGRFANAIEHYRNAWRLSQL